MPIGFLSAGGHTTKQQQSLQPEGKTKKTHVNCKEKDEMKKEQQPAADR